MTVGFCLVIAAVLAVSCAVFAAQLNRSMAAWFVLGALFGFIAVVALFALDPLPKLEPRA